MYSAGNYSEHLVKCEFLSSVFHPPPHKRERRENQECFLVKEIAQNPQNPMLEEEAEFNSKILFKC